MAIMDSTTPKTNPVSAQPTKPELDLTGQTLGDFRILRRLGRGGMGQVYLAEQLSLKRKVALKLLRPEMASNPNALQRFKAEAEAVARINHANIVQVYHIGEASNLQYMALEYVEGRNLREYLERKGPPDVLFALSIMRQVAQALHRAGEMGIIHRDIKPENILLTKKGEVKVADFGLSRVLAEDQPALNLTQSGITMGTPLYMSPEQVEGKQVDSRTDIYSFGITAYHMLAGHPPFQGSTAFEVAVAHVQKEPPLLASIRPDLPPGLCAIIHKMMAKDPNQRYQTGRDLLKDLVRLRESLSGMSQILPAAATPAVQGSGQPGPPSSGSIPTTTPAFLEPSSPVLSHPLATSTRRRWLTFAVIVSILLAGGAGVGFGWWRQQAGTRFGGQGGGTASSPLLPVAPSDTTAAEAVFSSQRRERVLTQAAEEYLKPASGNPNVSAGLGVCLDLGLFYLDEDRLDDAEKLFDQLEGIKQIRAYQNLGKLGRAIVLALRSQPEASNALIREFFSSIKGVDAKPARVILENQMLQQPRLRYWVAEALTYNRRNGTVDPELLPLLPGDLRTVINRKGKN